MGKAALDVVTRHRWLHPLIYLIMDVFWFVQWIVTRTGLAEKWTRNL